jgi:hypothetical protein
MFQLLHENRGQKLRLLILKSGGSCKQLKPRNEQKRKLIGEESNWKKDKIEVKARNGA